MPRAAIISTAAFAPSKVVPNSFFNDLYGEDVDTWLRQNVEIYERRWCTELESTAFLVENAARIALEKAGISAKELDLIIVATDTPEFVSPSTAAVVQYRLGAENAGTFDLNSACAGFVTGLDVASKYLISDEHYQYVLVVGAYAMSKHLNLLDKKTATLFADGAGAVILKKNESDVSGFLASELITKGEYFDWMGIYGGGTHQPTTKEGIENHDHQLKFVKKFPKELNPDMWTGMIHNLCQRIGKAPSDVNHFFITQININSIRETMDRLGLAHEKAHTVMHYFGYTGSACIPMALHDANEKGKLKKGDLIFFLGSGGGLAFASAAFRW